MNRLPADSSELDAGEDPREQIIRAVLDSIAVDGVDGTTIRRVAESVGASTGMITHYFSNKKELITETSTSTLQRSIAKVTDSAGAEASPQRLDAMADRYLMRKDPELPSMSFYLWYWAEATRDEALRQLFVENFKKTRELLANGVRSGMQSGQFRADLDPEFTADAFLSLIQGLRIRTALGGEVVPPERAFAIARWFLTMLETKDPD
jgi:AcrR family transcriptional regulator